MERDELYLKLELHREGELRKKRAVKNRKQEYWYLVIHKYVYKKKFVFFGPLVKGRDILWRLSTDQERVEEVFQSGKEAKEVAKKLWDILPHKEVAFISINRSDFGSVERIGNYINSSYIY